MDSTERFSDRVANYVRYRPAYPEALVETLRVRTGLTPRTRVADLGSGTGISAEPFLRAGCTVYAVEPNAEMRAAAESRHGANPRFHSVAATAEATGLPASSTDLVVAGQAFHWFDVPRVRAETLRILRSGGHTALFWNVRRTDSSPFLRDYEELLLAFGTDYARVRHENVGPDTLAAFFGSRRYHSASFANEQSFGIEGLIGRTLSASYMPAPDHPRHSEMLERLEAVFHRHAQGGRVRFEYDTELFFGRMEGDGEASDE